MPFASEDAHSSDVMRSEASLRQAQDAASDAEAVLRFERLSEKSPLKKSGVQDLPCSKQTNELLEINPATKLPRNRVAAKCARAKDPC